jgi:hypothetical protein
MITNYGLQVFQVRIHTCPQTNGGNQLQEDETRKTTVVPSWPTSKVQQIIGFQKRNATHAEYQPSSYSTF